jgi:hypothetical protein
MQQRYPLRDLDQFGIGPDVAFNEGDPLCRERDIPAEKIIVVRRAMSPIEAFFDFIPEGELEPNERLRLSNRELG